MNFLDSSISEQRSLKSIIRKNNRKIFKYYMTEKWLNETVESVVNVMKIRRMKINDE